MDFAPVHNLALHKEIIGQQAHQCCYEKEFESEKDGKNDASLVIDIPLLRLIIREVNLCAGYEQTDEENYTSYEYILAASLDKFSQIIEHLMLAVHALRMRLYLYTYM